MESCLFLCLVAITAGTVSAQGLVLNGTLGGSVEFNLNGVIPSSHQITWRTGGGQIYIARIISNDVPSYNHPYVNRSELFPNGTLRLDKLTRDDEGGYTATIENLVDLAQQVVSYQLNIILPVSDIKLEVNKNGLIWPGIDPVSLHCSANGTDVRYTWSLNGAPLQNEPNYNLTQKNSTLLINPVSSKDNGSFTCTASNNINTETSTGLKLNLASNVSAVTLTSNTSGVLWAEKDSVSLHCSAQGSAITFSWSQNGYPVPLTPPYDITQSDSPPNSNLTISPLSRTDTGPFICTATNLANSENSTATSLNLNWYPEGEMKCGGNFSEDFFTFICAWTNGHPAANVSMIFNDTTETLPNIVSKNVPLNARIQALNVTCSGDQLGRKSTCVLPLEPPRSPGHDNNTITKATQGEKVVLRVTLDSKSTSRSTGTMGVLPAKFTWYRYNPNKTEIISGGEFLVNSTYQVSTLSITNVTQAYSGKYECIASNLVGDQSFIFNINVTAKLNPPENAENGLDGGIIAGIVIAILAGLTIIGVIVFFILKKN